LDPGMKKDLKSVSRRFFDSKDVYGDLGVPWKRGLIFYGPAGNGKTISIKALMHTLASRKDSIPTLYVKSASRTMDIRSVFTLARQKSPCLLVLEDIDTIVTEQTRSYFFNEVDGLENNDGILMIATTNQYVVGEPNFPSP
jgi:transitional endoplasmic reticulum ATPase